MRANKKLSLLLEVVGSSNVKLEVPVIKKGSLNKAH